MKKNKWFVFVVLLSATINGGSLDKKKNKIKRINVSNSQLDRNKECRIAGAYVSAMGCVDGVEIGCVSSHNADSFHLCTDHVSRFPVHDSLTNNQRVQNDCLYADLRTIQPPGLHFSANRSKQNSIHVNVVSTSQNRIYYCMIYWIHKNE